MTSTRPNPKIESIQQNDAMISTYEQALSNKLSIGWITLHSPKTLNALTLEMANTALQQLQHWATRDDICCVVLQGDGRGFCAGGDVRRMRQGILDGDDYCEQFFEQEYRLDYSLHCYPKPVLVWGHGIVMGGGLGLFMAASHRVVTPSTRMGMPEINIGLYPDVGASAFLNALPAGLGLFLGITGCEWNAADAIALHMAQFLLSDEAHALLPAQLATADWSADAAHNHQQLTAILQQLPTGTAPARLTLHSDRIRAVCRDEDLLTSAQALQRLDIAEDWYAAALANLSHGCPVTAHIVAEQLRRGRDLSLADIFRMEWCVSIQCSQRPDFPEGVRAQLVDKDKQPRWQFASLADVPADYVMQHFLPPCTHHPLHDLADTTYPQHRN
jgi:enoyl-CoA hydratase/carnithine racemase